MLTCFGTFVVGLLAGGYFWQPMREDAFFDGYSHALEGVLELEPRRKKKDEARIWKIGRGETQRGKHREGGQCPREREQGYRQECREGDRQG